MAKITMQPCRIKTRSSARISARLVDHDATPTSANKHIKIGGSSSISSGENDTNNNNNITVTRSSSSNTSIHSNRSSSIASSTTTSKSHASLHYSSRAASPIVVPSSTSSIKNVTRNTFVDNRPESCNDVRRVDRSNQIESRSFQKSSLGPTPIIDIARSTTPSARNRTTTSRRGGRSGTRCRSPPTTYCTKNPHLNSDSSGGKSSQPTSQQRRSRLNGTSTPVGMEVSRTMGIGSSSTNYVKGTIPQSPKSPSSAAAAAAAAAKLLCDPSRMLHPSSGASTWYGNGGETDGESYDHGRAGDRSNDREYSHHGRSIQNRVDNGSQWSSHKSHFAQTQDLGYPHHEFKNGRPGRSSNGATSHKRSHHHDPPPHHEALVKFGTQNRHLNHHRGLHNKSQRIGRYGEMGSYDSTLSKRRNETDNIFQRQGHVVQENWNDVSGSDRYESQEQNTDDTDGGSGSFRNERIPQSGHNNIYKENAENEMHHNHRNHHHRNHFGNEENEGGIVVVNRTKSSMMGMQKKNQVSKESGGTSRVMGSPTPIHVPRAPSSVEVEENPGKYPSKPQPQDEGARTDGQTSHSSERSSVFRTRLRNEDESRSMGYADDEGGDMNSPHRLLLSLRSSTKSFDERRKSSTAVNNKEICDNGGNEEIKKQEVTDDVNQDNSLLQRILLSPKEPPRIHHSHNQRKIPNSLFFEPQRTSQTPRTPITPNNNHFGGTIDASPSPSFNLFDRTFDSPFVDAETHMQSSNCSTTGALTGSPNKLLKGLILCNRSFSPNCSPGQRTIMTPRLPLRPSLSAANSPYLMAHNFSFSPRPLQNYRSNSNSNGKNNTGGATSITSTPKVSDNVEVELETSPCGLSIGSVNDVGPNRSFGVMRKKRPPIMPSAMEMNKVLCNADRVVSGSGGRRIVLGMCDRLRHTSHDNKGYSIPSKRGLPTEEEVDGSGRQGQVEKRLCSKSYECPTPPLAINSNQARVSDISVRHHPQHDPPHHEPPPYVSEQTQNLTNSGARHTVGSPTERDIPHDAPISSSSSLKRNKTVSPLNGMNAPHFYQKLMAHKDAFQRFTFLLPALKVAMSHKTELTDLSSCPEDEGDDLGSSRLGQTVEEDTKTENSPPHRILHMPQVSYSPDTQLPSSTTKPSNMVIARRRLTSALCAFGGNDSLTRKYNSRRQKTGSKITPKPTIFRVKRDRDGRDSRKNSNCSDGAKSDKRTKYETALSNRYFENDNRISWGFEENPPVVLSTSGLKNVNRLAENNLGEMMGSEKRQLIMDEEINAKSSSSNSTSGDNQAGTEGNGNGDILPKSETKAHSSPSEDTKSVCSEISSKHHSDASMSVNSDQPKMRYRCKLCGKPKQNHTCPYQQSLQRSIGVTVYPAVNAFTACEPGILAPTLSEMNNFVHGQDGFAENTPLRPDRMIMQQPTGSIMVGPPGAPRNVTPGSVRNGMHHPSSSPLSTLSHTPHRTPFRVGLSAHYPPPSCSKIIIGQPTSRNLDGRRNRILSPPLTTLAQDLLFIDSTELRPEQYRIVTSSVSHDSFEYPSLPLPYTQRKKLSDNLFALSKGIPQLTDECAAVLRQARERDLWDVAVAELMTQVIVVIHCPENDHRLDGLSRYLLSLRFAC